MMARKRLTGGLEASRMSMTKLEPKDIREIRRAYDTEALSVRELAAEYKLGAETIRRIGRRDTFNWVPEYIAPTEDDLKASIKRTMTLAKENNPTECPYPYEEWTDAEKGMARLGVIPSKARGWYERKTGGEIVRIK